MLELLAEWLLTMLALLDPDYLQSSNRRKRH